MWPHLKRIKDESTRLLWLVSLLPSSTISCLNSFEFKLYTFGKRLSESRFLIRRSHMPILTHISHINPAGLAAISNGTTRCSRIAEYSGYHEC